MDRGVTYSVISSCVYSIKWVHKLNGQSDPTENGFVLNLLESAKRLRSGKVVKKDAVSSDMLKGLCKKFKDWEDLLHIRDLAMILIAFAGFLRYD